MAKIDLPFQYTQRGAQITKATADVAAKYHEQRDQDLENYLANLTGGGLSSAAVWDGTTLTGGGTALTAGGTDTVALAFSAAVGPKFDPGTGLWLGSTADWLVVSGNAKFTTTGLGMAVITGGGSALESSTNVTLIGVGATTPPIWQIGGTYFMDAASYNAIAGGGPEALLGFIALTVLSPGPTYVNALLAEPAGITVNILTGSAFLVG